jgi:ABC-type sugar transport system ATPase subunit
MEKKPLLELKQIIKEFSGTRALDGVNLKAFGGEVIAILGENGAGKSTLMKVLSGVWPTGSFSGEIQMGGHSRSFQDPRDAMAAGIAMIHQELSVFQELSIAEHLELDQLPRWIQWDELFVRTQKFLDSLGFGDLGLRAETRVGDLSVGNRQLVEIARALYRNAQVLVFDEPTSALTEQEVQRLDRIVLRLRDEGRAILYITHRMDEVFRLADRMIVLRDGRNAGEVTRGLRTELEPQLISWMVGRPIQDIYPPRSTARFSVELLRVKDLSVISPRGKRLVDQLSFTLHRGEILGLGGLLGAGRSETLEALFGVLSPKGPDFRGHSVSGEVWIHSKKVNVPQPRHAISARMAFVSEDRKGSGLVLGHSVRQNMLLPALGNRRAGMLSWVSEAQEKEESRKWGQELRLKAASTEQPVGELSGGNQQKVVLAKWLMTDPEILFLDEPTRGIDIGAKVEIYQCIHQLAERGLGIVLASSEMPELLGVCHRILVLREGRGSAELNAAKATQEDVMRAASL